jgi:hypothetical protein
MEILKECTSFKLEIVGQLIDSFLGEIGRGIYVKLGRSTISFKCLRTDATKLFN